MRLDDGREVLCTLALPLPLDLVGTLGEGISLAANAAGYTDVSILTDGSNRVVATPPARTDEPETDSDEAEEAT